MILTGAKVFEKEGRFTERELFTAGERICSRQEAEDQEVVDAGGRYAVPMLVDLHFHGCSGVDFCDGTEEAIQTIADYQLRNGIGAICPATMTYPEEKLGKIADAAASHRNGRGADLVGIHMEGPFINIQKKGAQNGAYVHKPDAEMFYRLQERANGLFKLCDLAPEVEGALDTIRELSPHTVVSLAHTCTDYETAREAFRQGASHMTHLYNAMPGISHREPGPIIAALEAGAEVELIADGIHVHPAMVRATFQMFGDDRVILISDSMMAAGLPDGDYALGGQKVTVKGPKAVLTEEPGTIAGSVTNLMDCMRRAVLEMGVPLESAVKAASVNPARSIGVEGDYGSLEEGRFADLLLLDEKLRIVEWIHKGKRINRREKNVI